MYQNTVLVQCNNYVIFFKMQLNTKWSYYIPNGIYNYRKLVGYILYYYYVVYMYLQMIHIHNSYNV